MKAYTLTRFPRLLASVRLHEDVQSEALTVSFRQHHIRLLGKANSWSRKWRGLESDLCKIWDTLDVGYRQWKHMFWKKFPYFNSATGTTANVHILMILMLEDSLLLIQNYTQSDVILRLYHRLFAEIPFSAIFPWRVSMTQMVLENLISRIY